jgi:delta 1-pyrroline-5-carboxylate dehydrogenase
MGIVVVLAPWNFPSDEILLLSIPALCAGNTVMHLVTLKNILVGFMRIKCTSNR